MEKFVYYGLLFDIYKDLLSENKKELFSLYYEENLTLQEIADNYKVSKSYVGSVIKSVEKKLDALESTLHMYQKKIELEKLLEIDDLAKIKEKIRELM